jgi:hypothetical protein
MRYWRTGAAVVVVAAGLVPVGGVAVADQSKTAEAAMAAAQRIADCSACDFDYGRRPYESARRGLVDISVGSPEGGGYHMILGHTGSRWARLWEGNGSTRDVDALPGKVAICMSEDGWTNIRKGPGTDFRQVGKVSQPTVKKAFEMRLVMPQRRQEGIGWYRISFNGRPAWVQNLRTMFVGPGEGAASACQVWRDWLDWFGPRQ